MRILIFFVFFMLIFYPTNYAQDSFLTGSDNGYKWQRTDYEAKVNLCKDIARRIGKHDWKYYFEAIDAFYQTIDSDPKILSQKIANIAGIISIMPSETIRKKRLIEAFKEGRLSLEELEIYDYLHNRWDFYEQRDGIYIPEKHDEIVLNEASIKFSKDKESIDKINWKVANIEAGIEPKPSIKLDKENVAVEIVIKDIHLLPDNILEVTVENKTAKQIVLPFININCFLFKGNTPVGYSCGITIWAENLGYKETKKYQSAPLSFDFDTVKIIGYINIDKIKANGLRSKIQDSNDPGETIIPVYKSEALRIK